MDLKLPAYSPSHAEREAIERTIAENAGASGGSLRHLLLVALLAVQRVRGHVSRGALSYISRLLSIPPAEAYGVASFYGAFSFEERPLRVVHVCDDVVCGLHAGRETDPGPSKKVAVVRSPCLGQCDRAPAALLVESGANAREFAEGHADHHVLIGLFAGKPSNPDPNAVLPQRESGSSELVLLRRVGTVDPNDIFAYRSAGGFEALRRAFAVGQAAVVREVDESGLLGRGGAAFPTGKKWLSVSRALDRVRYVVCNADESEPGTFKDRVLLEEDPFAIVEAMTIAGFAVGAQQGMIYVRAEYARARARMLHAIEQAREHGFLGQRVLGRDIRFDIELRSGAGAYICGEETALFASIEGYRGEPRTKPPFPSEKGLFGRPTVVNNVETLANVLPILLEGAEGYRKRGTKNSPGTRLFCMSGNVSKPGLYEVPHGTTLRELIHLAGGVPKGRSLQAVLLGGAAGVFVRPEDLDVELSFEGVRAKQMTLGSGVVVAFDDTVDLLPILARLARFFRDESCGQCVPCRVGTVRQEELVQRLVRGTLRPDRASELRLLADLGKVMQDASICGLGQTASSAIESALRCFPQLGACEDQGS